ncbi:ester cyclase [Kitasatospora sp. NPDC057015]|uniref:ester cyclase n=1 Tax=Kitasatospora sp. NPDC057015 TaxID=3346001 RepID=UPI003627FA4C
MDTIEQSRIEENREIVRAFIDALFTQGDLAAVDEYLAEDFLNHDPPFDVDTGREGMRRAAAVFRDAFPDWQATPDLLIAENDLVAEHFSATGTQRGELLGAPPTGRTVTLRGINIFRIRDGRIVERWGRLDELGFLRQLGLAPDQE